MKKKDKLKTGFSGMVSSTTKKEKNMKRKDFTSDPQPNKGKATRATYYVFEKIQHKIRYIAIMTKGATQKSVVNEAFEQYIKEYEEKNGEIPLPTHALDHYKESPN